MTSYGVVSAVKALLAAAVWPGAGGTVAFAKVFVSAGVDADRTRGQLRVPWAMIVPGALTVDTEEDDLVTQEFTIKLVNAVANDPYGETVVLGGAGPGTGLVSEGQGLLQLEAVLFDALRQLDPDEGITVQWLGASAISASLDDVHGYLAERDYRFQAWTGAGTSP